MRYYLHYISLNFLQSNNNLKTYYIKEKSDTFVLKKLKKIYLNQ